MAVRAVYLALVEEDTPHNYGLWVPDVPGLTVAASSMVELLEEAEIALASHIHLLRETGRPVRAPRSRTELLKDPVVQADNEAMAWTLVRHRTELTELPEAAE